MKKTSVLFTILAFAVQTLTAQPEIQETAELYPGTYTFEKALEFHDNGEYEKAIWFYINLYPDNKTRAVASVQQLAAALDTVEMSHFIKQSFAMHAPFDPTIASFDNGAPNIDIAALNRKGAWGDALIRELSGLDQLPASASEYNLRGLDKARAGDLEAALDDFNQAIELEPSGQVYYNRAYTKSVLEDFEGAISDYNAAIALSYRLAEAHYERGYCNEELENVDAAIDDYSKAIELDDNYADAYNNRAVAFMKKSDLIPALVDFGRAIEIRPNFYEAYVNRGFAKYMVGDTLGACNDWAKAAELGFEQANEIIESYCD